MVATLAAAVQGEIDRVGQTLTGRLRQLAERYADPLPVLTARVAELDAKVTIAAMAIKKREKSNKIAQVEV